MNPDPPHQTPLKITNQAVKGLEGEHKEPLPALVKQTLKTNHASVQKSHNHHQSVKKSGRNQTKIRSYDHTPAPAFIFHCSLTVSRHLGIPAFPRKTNDSFLTELAPARLLDFPEPT